MLKDCLRLKALLVSHCVLILFSSNRELSFKKGDVMVVKRQIDKNWIEGENNGRTGIFPTNYVEVRFSEQ